MTAQTLVADALVALGALLILTAALGMVRLPDIYHRTNAVAKASALGITLILLGVLVLRPSVGLAVTLLLAIFAQLFTAPIAGYTVGRAAYRSGTPLHRSTHRDDLASVRQRPEG